MTATPSNAVPSKMRRPKRKTLLKVLLPVALIAAGLYFFARGEQSSDPTGTVFTARRGPLEVLVSEGGTLEAEQSQEIRCEVQGQTKILSIVDEGTFVTPEDVTNKKILVELDSKEIIDEQTEGELEYQNAWASFTEAKEEYGIQMNQNQSDIKAAKLAVRFGRMDLEKYLGKKIAGDVIAQIEAAPKPDMQPPVEAATGGEQEAAEETASVEATPADTDVPAVPALVTPMPDSPAAELEPVAMQLVHVPTTTIDFTKYADPELLGDGEARQLLRKLEDELVVSEEEVGLATRQFEGTQRLYKQEFVTKTDLDNDEMKLKRNTIANKSAETAKDLFINYEFPKQAEKLLSDFEEAMRKLERAERTAISKMAQAEAKLKSTEARYNVQSRQRKEIQEQIEKCVIRATKPGLVVYGGSQEYWRDDNRIEEGAQVRERQVLITIPDTTRMTVNVKVHESTVKMVQKGQKARIVVSANEDKQLEGEVSKIGVLPNSENRWMNPEQKVYSTTVAINGTHDWLKPGMTANTEIIVDQLADVLYVPMQAVHVDKGERVCYVVQLGGLERRIVETGGFNDSFIEIKKGIEEGEVVLLRAPKVDGAAESEEGDGEEKEEKEEESEVPVAAAPAVAAA